MAFQIVSRHVMRFHGGHGVGSGALACASGLVSLHLILDQMLPLCGTGK
jgi:hypothetical protein